MGHSYAAAGLARRLDAAGQLRMGAPVEHFQGADSCCAARWIVRAGRAAVVSGVAAGGGDGGAGAGVAPRGGVTDKRCSWVEVEGSCRSWRPDG